VIDALRHMLPIGQVLGGLMALQIANPSVVSTVERLVRHTGLSKTAAVERAERTLVSSVTVVETRMVVHARRRGDKGCDFAV